jgi:hypothetical protein
MIDYQIAITDPAGAIVTYLREYETLDYTVRRDGGIGGCTLVVPVSWYWLFNPQRKDYRISVWRSIQGSTFTLEEEYLQTAWDIDSTRITVFGESPQTLLRRRISAYPWGNSRVLFLSGTADDIMKLVVRYNFISPSTARYGGGTAATGVAIGSYLTVAPSYADAATVPFDSAAKEVYDIVTDAGLASWQAGTWCAGIVTSTASGGLLFETYTTQFGRNQSDLTFSPDIGNVQNCVISYKYQDERTVAIVGGKGAGAARSSQYYEDTARITASPLARSEKYVNAPNSQNIPASYARGTLQRYRGVRQFTCDLISTPSSMRGIDYDVGDRLAVWFQGLRFVMRLDVVSVSIGSGKITEKAILRT